MFEAPPVFIDFILYTILAGLYECTTFAGNGSFVGVSKMLKIYVKVF